MTERDIIDQLRTWATTCVVSRAEVLTIAADALEAARRELAAVTAERDAIVDSLIGQNSVYCDVLLPRRSPDGVYKVYGLTASLPTKAQAVAAIRKAAGLDAPAVRYDDDDAAAENEAAI